MEVPLHELARCSANVTLNTDPLRGMGAHPAMSPHLERGESLCIE